jgi:hypothetical protein
MTKQDIINRLKLSNIALRIISAKLDYITEPYSFFIGDRHYTITKSGNDYQLEEAKQ